jgi:putative hemolysin
MRIEPQKTVTPEGVGRIGVCESKRGDDCDERN